VWPSLVILVLELVSLYVLARLFSSVLSTAAGAAIDLTAALTLALLLVVKSLVSGFVSQIIYREFAENETKIRDSMLESVRFAPSRTLRGQSIETVTHQVNVYPSNLTFSVYQQALKLMSDLAAAVVILVALFVTNPGLTMMILLPFGVISFVVGKWTVSRSARYGSTAENSRIRLVNRIARYLGGRNELSGSSLEPLFRGAVSEANLALANAQAQFQFITLFPRLALDAVCGLAIVMVVGAVSLGVAQLNQQDLAFSLAAAFKLAPYLTAIIAGMMQLGFTRVILEGYGEVTAALSAAGAETLNGVSAAVPSEIRGQQLEVRVGERTFTAGRGEILVIKGKSGSGKTTIAELVADVAAGRTPGTQPLNGTERPHIAFCSQFPAVLDAPLKLNLVAPEAGDAADAMIERYGLEHLLESPALNENTLSGGERQRIGIVRALNQAREIVVFDEPTAAIGKLYADKVKEDVLRLAREGKTVLIVTHDTMFNAVADSVLELT
jgi:ABC-type transport system involved in cytochrome bd biosynthesis fused ATPase/permease subunit